MSNLVGVRADNARSTLPKTEGLNPFLLSRRDRTEPFEPTSVTADALLAASRELERQRRLRMECRPDLRLYHLAVNAYVNIVNDDTDERLYMTPVVMGSTLPIWKAKYRIESTTPRVRFDIRHWIDATHSWAIGCSSVHLGTWSRCQLRDVVDHKMPPPCHGRGHGAPRLPAHPRPPGADHRRRPRVGVHTRRSPTTRPAPTRPFPTSRDNAPFATVALTRGARRLVLSSVVRWHQHGSRAVADPPPW